MIERQSIINKKIRIEGMYSKSILLNIGLNHACIGFPLIILLYRCNMLTDLVYGKPSMFTKKYCDWGPSFEF